MIVNHGWDSISKTLTHISLVSRKITILRRTSAKNADIWPDISISHAFLQFSDCIYLIHLFAIN